MHSSLTLLTSSLLLVSAAPGGHYGYRKAPAAPTQTIAELAIATPALSTLLAAVKAADLVETLSGEGPFTVFAPTNDAFAKIPAETLNGLLADKDALTAVLLRHVVPGAALKSGDVPHGTTPVKTAGGEEIQVTKNRYITVKSSAGKAGVIAFDILATNGVVHLVNSLISLKDDIQLVVTNEEAQKEKDTAGEANDTTEEAREVGTNDALKKQLGLGLGLILLLFALSYKIYDDSKPGRNFAKTVNQLQTKLCNGYYKNNLSMINLGPWSDNLEDKVILEEMFISQRFKTDKEEHSNLLDFFSWQAGASPKRLLVVGEQGAGKTTSIKFASRVWCNEVSQWKYRAALQLKYSFDHLHDKYGTPAWRTVSQSFHQIVSSLSSMIVFFLQNLSEMIFIGMRPIEATSYVQSITEVLQSFELKSVPELFLAFEFKDVCNKRFLVDIVKNVVVDIDISKISEVLDKGSETILLAFDGWDEYNSLKQDIGGSPEIDGIIKREERQNFNLIVTTRPWRSDDLLNTKRLQFKKVSITKFDTPKRNNFIENFFQFYPLEQMAEDLISALDNKASVVPKGLETEPRMLLYICNMWRKDKKIREDKFVSSGLFWDGIWALMTGTYNMKYPEKKISQEQLKGIRSLIGDFVNRNPGEISFETFYQEFGKADGLDLFYFGIYSTDLQDIPPWQLDQEIDVKPTYKEMLKEEGRRRRKIENDQEERRKKQTWFWK